MIKIIKKYNIKSILEIGTANSYSSHIFARYGAKVLSLEKNYKMYNLALKNLINSRLNKNIQVLFKDALLYDTNKKFDMIFYDPPFSFFVNEINSDLNTIQNLMEKNSKLIIHIHKSSEQFVYPEGLELYKEKKYGQSNITILKK